LLEFAAPATGEYFVRIGATSGTGEYVLTSTVSPLAELTISDFAQVEGNADSSAWVITVTRSHNESDVSVEVRTVDGTASSPSDYTPVETAIHFTAGGALTETILVSVKGDAEEEFDETFQLVLSNPVNAAIAKGTGTVTILDDDRPRLPAVTSVRVSSTRWEPSLLSFVDPELKLGYVVPQGADQLATLPWSDINQIHVRFTTDVAIGVDDIRLIGISFLDYGPSIEQFTYDPQTFVATIRLGRAISADKLLLTIADSVSDRLGNALDGEWINGNSAGPSGDGVPGTAFVYRLNVLAGDVDHSTVVSSADILSVKESRFESTSSTNYSALKDIDGSGTITGSDTVETASRRFTFLPPGEPGGPAEPPPPPFDLGFLVDPYEGVPGDKLDGEALALYFARLAQEEPLPDIRAVYGRRALAI
jgi:hypothetical protein